MQNEQNWRKRFIAKFPMESDNAIGCLSFEDLSKIDRFIKDEIAAAEKRGYDMALLHITQKTGFDWRIPFSEAEKRGAERERERVKPFIEELKCRISAECETCSDADDCEATKCSIFKLHKALKAYEEGR